MGRIASIITVPSSASIPYIKPCGENPNKTVCEETIRIMKAAEHFRADLHREPVRRSYYLQMFLRKRAGKALCRPMTPPE
jgi:hypothetical protein